jgi:hypothetical protein
LSDAIKALQGEPTLAEIPIPPDRGVECCASGRCEVCCPGFVWGRD